jgi:hypothetical protein
MCEHPPADAPSPPFIRLSAGSGPDGPTPTITARIQLSISRQPIRFEITVPTRSVQLRDLLPIFHGLTDVIVEQAVRGAEQEGGTISCRKGCGACCRQPVPISESEARAIVHLVAALPEPRQSQVRARFAEAAARLAPVWQQQDCWSHFYTLNKILWQISKP